MTANRLVFDSSIFEQHGYRIGTFNDKHQHDVIIMVGAVIVKIVIFATLLYRLESHIIFPLMVLPLRRSSVVAVRQMNLSSVFEE